MKKIYWLLPVILLLTFVLSSPLTIYADAKFSLSELSISPSFAAPANEGEDVEVNISVKVTNTGDAEGVYTATLKIDGKEEASEDVILEAGDSEKILFSVKQSLVGEYDVEIGDLTGSFTIIPYNMEIKSMLIDPLEADPGESVTISIIVKNKSSENSLLYDSLKLKINDSVVDSKVIELEAGASDTITFTVNREEVGDYIVQIGDKSQSFTVKKSFWSSFPPFIWLVFGVIGGILIMLIIFVFFTNPRKRKPKTEVPKTGKQRRLPPPQGMQPRAVPPQPAQAQAQPQPFMQAQGMPPQQPAQQPAQPQMPPRQMPPPPQGQPMPPVQPAQQPVQTPHQVPAQPMPSQQPAQVPQQPAQSPQLQAPPRQMPPSPPPPTTPTPVIPVQPRPMAAPVQRDGMPPPQVGVAPFPSAPAAKAAPIFSVGNLQIHPTRVKESDPVTITAIVTNRGNAAGQYSMVLRIGNVVEKIVELSIEPGNSQTATFEVVKENAGEYYVEADGLRGMFTVIQRKPAAFNISRLTIQPEKVSEGEPITISATVTNSGEVEGTYTGVLRIKGIEEGAQEITIPPGESEQLVFTVMKQAAGFYPVELEHLMGRFVVEMDWK
jgi:hypothetical protein